MGSNGPSDVATLVTQFVGSVQVQSIDHEAVHLACLYLAMVAHKDISWDKMLKFDDRELEIKALKAEKDSLMSTIPVLVDVGHPEYQAALKEAISGRFLLDLKGVRVWKARGVKQEFKKNKETVDGPGFVYYGHVAKLASVRMLLSSPITEAVAESQSRTCALHFFSQTNFLMTS